MIDYPSMTRVLPLVTIRRERVLPAPGEVLVHQGARVEPITIVARAEIPDHYYILNVAQTLGVSPDAAERGLRIR